VLSLPKDQRLSPLFLNLNQLHKPPKKSASESFVTGHDFSRADKPIIFLPSQL
jgi:hypothetical protein